MKIPPYTKLPIPHVDFKRNSDLTEPVPFTPITIQENHTMRPPSDSQSVCNYSINIVPLEAGGQQEPEPCQCTQSWCENNLGGVPVTDDLRNGASAFNSTSAWCTVLAETTESRMYWACNFGTFRNLGNIPVGRIEIREETDITRLSSPLALAYNHPLNSYLRIPVGGLVPDTKCELVQGGRVIAMRCYPDGSVAPVGVDTFGGGRASLVTVDNQTCLRWMVDDGSRYLFHTIDGTLISFTAPDGQVLVNDGTYLNIKRNIDGSICQIWNLWDGLLDIEPIAENEYRISLYTPAQVGELDSAGYYTVSGAPIKTCTFTNNRFSITEQVPQHQAYVVTWWQDGLTWNIGKGTGEDTIYTVRQRMELEHF